MISNCELKDQQPLHTLSIRTTVPMQDLPQTIGQAYGAIMQYLAQLGENPGGEPFVAYYNLDMQNLDVEMGFPVTKALAGSGPIQAGRLPECKVAVCVFTGPYQEMAPAYDELTAFIQAQGYEPSGMTYEYYLNSPDEVPTSELQTRIVFPLK